jgi:glycosyltransferase involved in cell wall biosynthesis
MKILWFTTSPSSAEKNEGKTLITGGWIKSLEKALKKFHPEVLLGIAFFSDKSTTSFDINGTKYFPIKRRKKGKILKHLSGTNINKNELKDHIKKFCLIINSFKPDLIHIHGTENTFGLIPETSGIPIVLSIQGILTVCLHKFFSGISRKELKRGISLFGNRFLFLFNDYRYLSKLEQDLLKKTRYIFGRTYWDRHVSTLLSPNAKYFHIDRVLRDNFYNNEWAKKRNNTCNIITTIRSNIYKGLETVIKAASLLNKTGINYKWHIAGLEPDDLLIKMMKKKVKEVSDKITFRGRLAEEEIINALLKADIFVNASHIENSPNGVAEALILGMPVIATHAGGTSTYINDRINGILIQDGDPWSMAGAILELLKNEEFACELGRNARKAALKRHNPERISDNIVKAYKTIIEENSGG